MTAPVNQYHARLCRELGRLGIQYTEEYPVGRYSVDIYIPEVNRFIEVDGPYHISPRADARRDAALRELEPDVDIVHIKVGTPVPEALQRMIF